MLPFKLVYHDDFDLHLGDHVFPSLKYRLIREMLLESGFATPEDFVAPEPAADEDLLLVHTPEWIRRLRTGTLSYEEVLRLEIPYSADMVRAFWLMAGGTTLAARLATAAGASYCVGGGFHHAFADHGEGFCAINDIAVAIRCLQRDRVIRRAMVLDCDVHQGNGTAAVFAGDPSVFTVSLHQTNIYPSVKPPSDIDVHLADGTGDQEYMDRMNAALHRAIDALHPDLMIYVAGADPYEHDQLGGLRLSIEGLKRRDRLVFQTARHLHVPVAVVLAGGYALRVGETVQIHCNTARVAAEVFGRTGDQKAEGGAPDAASASRLSSNR
ncbi:MAG TPA: histone deacetylase [Bryobacteraceae bacterium]|nr:histone deacetylase [Bryobacteraceae bacterium]